MKIALFQTSLAWENPASNRTFIEEYFMSEEESFDLFVLPEMFSSGFTMNPENVAETMDGETVSWMKSLALKKDCAICGSLVISENNSFYNRFIFVHPNGKMDFYDKRHLFSLAGEHEKYSKGTKKVLIEYKGWKICPQICYDLRFPVWSRNNSKNPYDLLIYVANWPEVRITAWEKLLYARAIENQCYVAAVNRIGVEGEGVNCIGNSMLIDSKGDQLWKATDSKEETKTALLSMKELNAFRKKFPVLEDGDGFTLQ